SGFGTGCEGHKLCGVVRVRVTTHRCPMSPCTTTDLELTNLSDTGLLHRHKRQLQAEDEHQHRGLRRAPSRPARRIELLGCGLRRRDGPTPPIGLTFACGMLAPWAETVRRRPPSHRVRPARRTRSARRLERRFDGGRAQPGPVLEVAPILALQL